MINYWWTDEWIDGHDGQMDGLVWIDELLNEQWLKVTLVMTRG